LVSGDAIEIPQEGAVVVVRHEYGVDAGRVGGVMPGRKSGTHRDRQPKLILTNGTTCSHVPLDSIREVRAVD
jgi:hypothetical protein